MPAQPTVFFLHFLGGSARAWTAVEERLRGRAHCVSIDLPGFGSDRARTGYSVSEMADAVAQSVRKQAPADWSIVGHSMGAKIAAVVARRAENGEDGLGGLARIVLIAGSPPAPEPMGEEQRAEMLGWFNGDNEQSRAEAQRFIAQNISRELSPDDYRQAVQDVLSADPASWRNWLNVGSKEDWSDRIGVLQTPALVIAGEDDVQLGPEGQGHFTVPHYARVRLVTLPGAKHLLPYEQPDAIARLIAEHLQ